MTDQLIPAVVYGAKSTEDTHGSIPEQIEDCRAMAEREGWTVVGVFRDEAFSAYHRNRGPGLEQAKRAAVEAAAEHGRCVLVAQESDRFARGAGDAPGAADHLGEIYFAMKRQGVELWSVRSGQLDLLRAMLEGERAHDETARKSDGVAKGIRRRAVERRQFIGGRRPYGYRHRDRTDDGHGTGPLVIDHIEANTVRSMFADYVAGVPQRSIAIALNEAGVPTLTGGAWYATTVSGMLRNPLYKGWITHHGESFASEVPPIVDDATWEQARQRREALAKTRGGGRGRQTRGGHLLTNGLLVCTCGAPMGPVTKPNRTSPPYEVYTCTRRLHHGPSACAQPPIKRDLIDNAVWQYFEQVALDVESMRDDLAEQVHRALGEADRLRDEAEDQVAQREAAYERVEGDYLRGVLPVEDWTRFKARLTSEITAARAEADQHARQREAVEARMAGFDAEAAIAKELAAIRALIVGEVQAGRAGNLDGARSVLRRLFVGFELTHASAPFGSGALSGRGQGWVPNESTEDLLSLVGGYSLWPVIRPEAVDLVTVDSTGFPAVQRAALSLSDNLCARLPDW